LPGSEQLAAKLLMDSHIESGDFVHHQFPDGESYIRVLSSVRDAPCVILADFRKPNDLILPICFLAKTLKSVGALKVILVAPYLAYMRQDVVFKEGEGITSHYFASLLSSCVDELVTIDPHLHRIKSLDEIYSIPTVVLSAAGLIGEWIKQNVQNGLILGPDSESDQWVIQTAQQIGIPYLVLEKKRLGDKEVLVSEVDSKIFLGRTPVIIDDIISTGHTMIETVKNVAKLGLGKTLCIGIHAVFAGTAYEELLAAKPSDIITTNTLFHPSNQIDVSSLLLGHLKKNC